MHFKIDIHPMPVMNIQTGEKEPTSTNATPLPWSRIKK